MYKIKETDLFSQWLLKLKDIRGQISIIRRVKIPVSNQSKDIEKSKKIAKYQDEQ